MVNRLLREKAINILHCSCIKPIRKDQLKYPDFDLIEVNSSIRELELLCVLAL